MGHNYHTNAVTAGFLTIAHVAPIAPLAPHVNDFLNDYFCRLLSPAFCIPATTLPPITQGKKTEQGNKKIAPPPKE